MSSKDNELKAIEAAIFSSSEPLTVDGAARLTGVPKERVQNSIKTLTERYNGNPDTSLALGSTGRGYFFTLKDEFSSMYSKATLPEIPLPVLRTLVVIMYKQPILQTDLKTEVGSCIYSHLKTLEEKKLISRERRGRTHLINTTQLLEDYLGIDMKDRDAVMRKLSNIIEAKTQDEGEKTEGRT